MDHPPSAFQHKPNRNGWYESFPPLPWIELPSLRHLPGYKFLCIHWAHRKSFDSLYSESIIPKRSGGERLIENPHPVLKTHQRNMLDLLDASANYHDCCHGFRRGRSIKTNALPHVGKDLVINLDLKDFFPSITSNLVKKILVSLGYNSHGETLPFLTSLVTRDNRLPQGAPTSPAIANLVCCDLDRKISEIVTSAGGEYTRYADDISISGKMGIQCILPSVRQAISSEGFSLNNDKTRLQRRGKRQEVTGLTVNEKVSIPRHIRKKIRAAIHCKINGKQPTWNGCELSDDSLKGHIDYLTSIHPEYIESYSDLF